jgi:hypothetical protein
MRKPTVMENLVALSSTLTDLLRCMIPYSMVTLLVADYLGWLTK